MSKFHLFASKEYDSEWACESFRGSFDTLEEAQKAIFIVPLSSLVVYPFAGFVKGDHDIEVHWAQIATTNENGALVFVSEWFASGGEWVDLND